MIFKCRPLMNNEFNYTKKIIENIKGNFKFEFTKKEQNNTLKWHETLIA